jgi:hypothetical protein
MDFRNALQVALDPARILVARGLTADPWQRQLLLSDARRILLNCSRQSGKSTAVAALVLHTALVQRGSLTLVLSPSLRQSVELFRKVEECYHALGQPVRALSSTWTRLELANQSRIVCLPAREETVRSFSGVALLVIDEAARVPDDLYRSVRPMLAVSGGRLVCLSTPFGRRGFFWREWAREQQEGDPWQRFRIPWRDCPRIAPAFIEEERVSLGDVWVRQEYECSFETLTGLVYPDFEERCGCDAVPETGGRAVGGIDFGFRNPFCALWGVLDRDDVLWIDGERYLSETPIHEHAAALPRGVTWYADPAGRTEREELRRAGLIVRAGDNDIRAGIAAVTARLRTGRLKVLRRACPHLLAEARLYRYASVADDSAASELPVDAHNHALAALRYLISRLDAGFLARFRKGRPAPEVEGEAPTAAWLRRENEALW